MASKLHKDLYVKFKTAAGVAMRGRVTAAYGRKVRVVDKDGKQYRTAGAEKGQKILYNSIRPFPMGVFVLDTQLDKGWRSKRQSARFWEEYCYHSGWTFAYERVHSLDDLNYVLGNRTIQEHVLLFNGHGSGKDGWLLSNGEFFTGETPLKMNPKNKHKLVVFSSCELGANEKLCRGLKDVLGAEAVIAYRGEVWDPICFLAEPALFHLVCENDTPASATEKVCEAMKPWKGINKKYAKQFPIVCF